MSRPDSIFLATTALPDFWEKNGRLLFLGDWCLRYEQRAAWENLDYQVCPYPWDDRRRLAEAENYCRKVYEGALARLREALNDVHGVSHELRYWRIVLGPWLLRYVQEVYEGHCAIAAAIRSTPGLRTFALAPESFSIPLDVPAFRRFCETDRFRLQIYSRLCAHLGVRIERYIPLHQGREEEPRHGQPSLGKRVAKYVNHFIFRRWRGRVPVWLVDSGVSLPILFRLALATRFKALPFDLSFLDRSFGEALSGARVDKSLRAKLKKRMQPLKRRDEFSDFLMETLIEDMPISFVEGYTHAVQVWNECDSPPPGALIGIQGYYDRSFFPFLAAELAARGTKLILLQHGGSYGAVEFHSFERHEQKIADEYWTWGWEHGLDRHCKPMPSLKLVANSLCGHSGNSPEPAILYCGNVAAPYLVFIWSSPVGPQWKATIDWEIRFIHRLPAFARKRLLIRTYPTDYGWSQKQRLIDAFPGEALRFDDSKSIQKNIRTCGIVVVDNNFTVFLEALNLDKPTVLFWDPRLNELRITASPLYDKLRSCEILHDTPEAAADKVASISNDPDAWWRREDVQEARKDFCEKFAWAPKNWREIWVQELLRLSSESRSRTLPVI